MNVFIAGSYEDEYGTVEIIGVYATEEAAQAALLKANATAKAQSFWPESCTAIEGWEALEESPWVFSMPGSGNYVYREMEVQG